MLLRSYNKLNFLKAIGLVFATSLAMASSASAADYRLPFDGQWFAIHAGDTVNVNHHMNTRSQWFGVDLMKTRGGSIVKGEGLSLLDYYSWGEPVLAPADGIVRLVRDGLPDNPIGLRDEVNALGNYVVVEVGTGEFVYLAHLQEESVLVEEGASVKAGQPLAKCGNSGNSEGPHIHMHVQDQLEPDNGIGMNVSFKGITVLLSGKQFDNVNWPLIKGLFVWQ